jgi:hypothetical protein
MKRRLTVQEIYEGKPLFKEQVTVDGEFIKGSITNQKLEIKQFIDGPAILAEVLNVNRLNRFIAELTQIRDKIAGE